MLSIKKLFYIVIIGLIVHVSHAENPIRDSGPFYVEGGVILPQGTLNMPLKTLPKGILNISCDLINPNYNKPHPVVIETHGIINGISPSTDQHLLNRKINKYEIHNIRGRNNYGMTFSLLFTNLDTTDSIYVENCVAVYSTQ